LERTASNSTDIQEDRIYAGALVDTGEVLILRDAAGDEQDRAGAPGPWFAPEASDTEAYAARASMERRDPMEPGTDPSNWAPSVAMVGSDADHNPIRGTPAYRNSVTREP